MSSSSKKEWSNAVHSLNYLQRADSFSHRREGEGVLVDIIPTNVSRILDIGSGDGRLIRLVKEAIKLNQCSSNIEFVAIDISPTMISMLKNNFGSDNSVKIMEYDLDNPLSITELGYFDVIVSSFAIHHLKNNRKYSLYEEIYDMLNSGGIFCNLEHVSSVSVKQHLKFLDLMDIAHGQGDRTNRLLSVERQLQMLREIGYIEVDCYWKWYEMALLVGFKI